MPSQKGTSILAQLAPQLKGAYNEVEGKEVTTDTGGRLPPGIIGGVAQLVDCRIAKVKEGGKNAGKLQFLAAGVVKEPEGVNGIPVRGLRTSVIIPLYDTPGRKIESAAEHYQEVMNAVSALQGHKQITDDVAPENIEATMSALVQVKPHFRFRTWRGNKQDIKQIGGKWYLVNVDDKGAVVGNPVRGPWASEQLARVANPYAGRESMTNEVWGSLVDYSDNGQLEASAVEDDTKTAVEEPVVEEEVPNEAPTAEEIAEEETDLDALAEAANGSGPEAAAAERKFVELAAAAGISKEQVKEANSWTDVVEMLRGASAGKEGPAEIEEETEEEVTEEEEAAEPATPSKGDTTKYTIQVTVKNKKTGKRTKKDKQIEAEVLSVNTKAQTVTLKNLEDGTSQYKDVPWNKLEE